MSCAPCAASRFGCGGQGCARAPSLLERAANPNARKLGTARGTLGDLLPHVVYPSDVQKLKERIDPGMRATDAGVDACTVLSEPERAAWKTFYASWRVFFSTPIPWLFGASNDWDDATAFQALLAGWQEQLRTRCSIPGPVQKAEEGPDLSAIKWASAAVIVVAAVYALRTLAK